MEKIKAFLSSAWKFLVVKVGPFFNNVAKPAGKALAIAYAHEECNRQADKLKYDLANGGVEAVNKRIDKLQVSLKARILNIPLLPKSLKERIEKIINDGIDRFQEKLVMGLSSHGADFAIDLLAQEIGDYIEAQINLL